MSQARAARLADDDRLRVTIWSFAPGESTGEHTHELDYAVVPVTGGVFEVTTPDGQVTEMTQQLGLPYFRSAGAVHDVKSVNADEAVFVEVELKKSS